MPCMMFMPHIVFVTSLKAFGRQCVQHIWIQLCCPACTALIKHDIA